MNTIILFILSIVVLINLALSIFISIQELKSLHNSEDAFKIKSHIKKKKQKLNTPDNVEEFYNNYKKYIDSYIDSNIESGINILEDIVNNVMDSLCNLLISNNDVRNMLLLEDQDLKLFITNLVKSRARSIYRNQEEYDKYSVKNTTAIDHNGNIITDRSNVDSGAHIINLFDQINNMD
jgi:hypothetical protein